MKQAFSYYDDQFYSDQADRSYSSAVVYANHLFDYIQPTSVVDVGCGRGTWLKAFYEQGVEKCVGLDGIWNSQEKMISQAVQFFPINLASPSFTVDSPYDLAVSLEVAEHLPETSADNFIDFLVQLSSVVLFSAAYVNQGGDNHLNEQPHSYWAAKFLERSYIPFDLFRPRFWGDSSVDFCYRQNTFLYVSQSSDLISGLACNGVQPIEHIAFMDCIHPHLYAQRSSPRSMIMRSLGQVTPSPIRPIVKSILRRLS